jgi:hypothetical protein
MMHVILRKSYSHCLSLLMETLSKILLVM